MNNANLMTRLRNAVANAKLTGGTIAASLGKEAADALQACDERNADLEEIVDKMQEGMRLLQQHQSKRRRGR